MRHNIRCPFEIKALRANEIEGHGSVFGNVDLGGDIVMPGAFKRSLAEHRAERKAVPMLWQHQHDAPIGVWSELREDDVGLAIKGELAQTQLGQEGRTLIKMGAVSGLSIGGELLEFDFNDDGNRLIKEFKLWEISPVTFAMNTAATIEAVKSMYPTARLFEKHLRDAGYSKSEARQLVHELGAGGMPDDDGLRDADEEVTVEAVRKLREQFTAGLIRSHIGNSR